MIMCAMKFRAKGKSLSFERPVLMGVLNVTPDSFSDGGRFLDTKKAVARGLEMSRQGARIIDVGGESTRPGADAVSAEEQHKRIIPVVRELSKKTNALISVDTSRPEVAEAALLEGAHIVNDVTGLLDERMIDVVASNEAGVVIMHMQGTPLTMQASPKYADVVSEVKGFLQEQAEKAQAAGVQGIMVDPGIGFGKTYEHNLSILKNLDSFQFGYPVCVGVSRKSFIGKITGDSVGNRLEGTLAAVAMGVANGANVLRVHDVAECRKAADVAWAIAGKPNDFILVDGVRLKMDIGILDSEKGRKQDVTVRVKAFADLKSASASGSIRKTIDYRTIVSAVEKTAAKRFDLLESFAFEAAGKVRALGASKVRVRACKPSALKNGLACVEVER